MLAEFDRLFGEYVYRVYDSGGSCCVWDEPGPGLREGPGKGWAPTHTLLVPYDESFVVWCLPSTRTGLAKVQPRAGIKVNYLYYWNDVNVEGWALYSESEFKPYVAPRRPVDRAAAAPPQGGACDPRSHA